MRLCTLTSALLLPLATVAGSGDGEVVGTQERVGKRVAIIGAGAAGSSTAYFLSQNASAAGIPTRIEVFERNPYVGGRTTTVNVWSDPRQPIELGGSIFVEVNHILVTAKKTFNLEEASQRSYKSEGIPDLGVWNGNEFVFTTTSKGGWWDMAKLLWEYGYAPVKTNSLMKSTVNKFLQMYEAPFFPWKSLSDVVQEVGLTEVTGLTGEQFLKNNGVGVKFANDIIQASTRVNYASNLGLLHGLETMVCMAASGGQSVDGGNWRIFDSMLKSSPSISTHLNTTVLRISTQPDGTHNVTTSSGEVNTFDEVVLASPLQYSNLTIDPNPKHVPDQIPYVHLHVTLFASPHRLHPKAFNLADDEQVPQYVLTTLQSDENYGSKPNVGKPGFFSISIVGTGVNPLSTEPRAERIYKIFSAEPIGPSFLSNILRTEITDEEAETGAADGAISWIHHKLWQSYPYEFPRVTFDEIKLDDHLWYTSAIESFISTMETSALMGKNVAALIVDEWTAQTKEDGEDLKVQGESEWEYSGLKQGQKQEPLKAKL